MVKSPCTITKLFNIFVCWHKVIATTFVFLHNIIPEMIERGIS